MPFLKIWGVPYLKILGLPFFKITRLPRKLGSILYFPKCATIVKSGETAFWEICTSDLTLTSGLRFPKYRGAIFVNKEVAFFQNRDIAL